MNPDGTPRGNSGQLRDRTFTPQSEIAQLLDDLANVIGGFDYALEPSGAIAADAGTDVLHIYQPYRGVTRESPLVYGTTVSGFTRNVSSANYANYWRTLGYNPAGDATDDAGADTTQLYAEDWNADANDVDRIALGTWMAGDNASDVQILDTLVERAQGNIEIYGALNDSGAPVASWTVTLAPGMWYPDTAEPGDMVPLVVQSGRLNLDTMIRVLGMNFEQGDDGDETIELEVGRPTASFFDLLTRADRDVDAIARREEIPTGLDAPVGAMYDWPGSLAPYSWQFADGGPLARVDYPELFDVIGYTFGGSGDTFNKPDCRGRVLVGAGQGAGLANRPRAATGGAESVAITQAQLAAHGHPIPAMTSAIESAGHGHTLPATTGNEAQGHTHNTPAVNPSGQTSGVVLAGGGTYSVLLGPAIAGATLGAASPHGHNLGGSTGGASAPHTHTIAAGYNVGPIGNGAAHENMPPFIALAKIIRVLPPRAAAARRRRSAA